MKRPAPLAHAIEYGSVRAMLYPTPTRGRPGWTLCYRDAQTQQRRRVWVRDDEAARAALKAAWQPLTTAEEKLAELEELARLTGRSARYLVEEARAQFVRRLEGARPRLVAEVVEEYMAGKEKARPGRWQVSLAKMLRRFAAAFQTPLHAIQDADLQRWLDGLQLGVRSRHNYRDAVAALFRYARRRKYIAADHDPTASVELPRKPKGKIQPYSPEEMEAILQHTALHAPRYVPYLALRAFSGIRYEETGRLEGRAVHLPTGWIELGRDQTKTARRRLVKILPALRSWWKAHPGPAGAIIAPHPSATMGPVLVKLIRAAGVTNRHNGLRDSFISYRMAVTQDVALVAQESGNSPQMIAESYRETRLPDGRVITPKLGAAYFASRATRPANVVRLRAQAG